MLTCDLIFTTLISNRFDSFQINAHHVPLPYYNGCNGYGNELVCPNRNERAHHQLLNFNKTDFFKNLHRLIHCSQAHAWMFWAQRMIQHLCCWMIMMTTQSIINRNTLWSYFNPWLRKNLCDIHNNLPFSTWKSIRHRPLSTVYKKYIIYYTKILNTYQDK